jgi:hypothetical protein
MATIAQTYLFSWRKIETMGEMLRLVLVLSVLPDEKLVSTLEKRRGRGRDDYPIRPTFNATIAGIVFGHESIASLRRDLMRNAELRQVCGFDPLEGADAVPTDDAFSRFLELLIEHEFLIVEMFHTLVEQLVVVLPDLGAKLAVDSKAIPSHGNPVRDENKREQDDRRRDPDADFGKKTYKGERKDGSTWEKVKSWFGYKLHLLVDSNYELPLAFELTNASAGDPDHMMPLVDELADVHPEIIATAEQITADKAYDTIEDITRPFDDYSIKPVIDIRALWKGEKTRPLFADRVDSFIYDEKGLVSCVCPVTDETRAMCFWGFEKDRDCLKYRCPAATLGFECKGRSDCEARASTRIGDFGRVIRIGLELDRRIFTPIARQTPQWKEAYKKRSAVERVNSRVDQVLGFARHFIRGMAKMKTRVSLALVVMLAMALGRIRADQKELMRSVLQPVAQSAA